MSMIPNDRLSGARSEVTKAVATTARDLRVLCRDGELGKIKNLLLENEENRSFFRRISIHRELGTGCDLLERGKTPLAWAAYGGHYDVCEFLLQHEQCHAMETFGVFEEQAILYSGSLEILKLFVSYGASIHACATNGSPLIHWMCEAGVFEAVKWLHEEHNVDLTVLNGAGESCMHLAALGGYPELMHYLLGKGLDSDLPSSRLETPLHCALTGKSLTAVKWLVEGGANIEHHNEYHQTPLMGFVVGASFDLEEHFPILEYMISKGADVRACGPVGNRSYPYFVGCMLRHVKVTSEDVMISTLQLLLTHGAPFDGSNRFGNVFQECVAHGGSKRVLSFLKDIKGMDVNEPQYHRMSSITLAIRGQVDLDTFRWLLRDVKCACLMDTSTIPAPDKFSIVVPVSPIHLAIQHFWKTSYMYVYELFKAGYRETQPPPATREMWDKDTNNDVKQLLCVGGVQLLPNIMSKPTFAYSMCVGLFCVRRVRIAVPKAIVSDHVIALIAFQLFLRVHPWCCWRKVIEIARLYNKDNNWLLKDETQLIPIAKFNREKGICVGWEKEDFINYCKNELRLTDML